MSDSIQPIVLVGGASTRFGRDKLREPVGGGWLVDRPIAVLREVFGARVAAVGNCDPRVAARADRHVADRYPGTGPLGGIAAAIEEFGADVFVLAGDMPVVTADVVRAILVAGAADPDAWAVLARSDRPEPCIGLYRRACLAALKAQLAGHRSLRGVVPDARMRLVPIDAGAAINANTPDALRAAYGAGGPSAGL